MTAKTVTVNYTPEQTVSMVANYAEGMTVADLATLLGKSTRSIIAKLSREGVYQKKEYKTKTGETVVKKDALADQIGMLLNATESETESLTKVNKTLLKKILDSVQANMLDKNQVI